MHFVITQNDNTGLVHLDIIQNASTYNSPSITTVHYLCADDLRLCQSILFIITMYGTIYRNCLSIPSIVETDTNYNSTVIKAL